MSISYHDVSRMPVEQYLADYYVLERLVADGSRTARIAQRKLEAYAAPRLMRYLSDVCGGELRHMGGGEGCGGWECQGEDTPEVGICICCDEGEDAHDPVCTYCSEYDYACEGESLDEEDPDYHSFEDNDKCGCYCPSSGICEACQWVLDNRIDYLGVPDAIRDWLNSIDRGSRSGAWDYWHDFHDEHGKIALKWLMECFRDYDWPDGYGGQSWAFIAQVAWEYADGQMSAHAFMDRCWTLHHNGGNVFDKMYDDYTLVRMLNAQAADNYRALLKHASPVCKELWAVRPYVLADSLDRDPTWLGTNVPQEVDW